MAADGTSWLEHIGSEVCWRLLASTPVGRVGVLVDSAPEIFPVNHVVDGETIVFRTDDGTKLRGIERSPSVCFEVDDTDPALAVGWSVLVKGRACEVVADADLERLREMAPDNWAVGDKSHWVRIAPTEVSGRRIGRSATPTDPHG